MPLTREIRWQRDADDFKRLLTIHEELVHVTVELIQR
jgi:hypothetical protein